MAALLHQALLVGLGALGQGGGTGGLRLDHPLLPAPNLVGQLQQGLALLFRLPLQLASLPHQPGLAIARSLLLQQGLLAGVGGEEGLQLLVEPRLQLI